MIDRTENKGAPAQAGVTPYRAPFKAPKFRIWPSGKAATMPMYGQRFRIHPEGDEFVLRHMAFHIGDTFDKCPYECLARFDTMQDAQAAAHEIARMAYDNPGAFQKPQWLIDQHRQEREEWEASLRERNNARLPKPDSDFAYIMPRMLEDDGAVKTARALSWLIEELAPDLLGADLPDSERYRLSAAARLIERSVGRQTSMPADGNVIQFPGAAE